MFKRVERRIRKKEEEDELGLDEETKEMLGLNAADTDSEESDSSSDSGGDSEDEQGLGQDDEASDAEEGVMGAGEESEEESGAGSDEEDDEDEAPMSVSEALQNPLWHVSLEPEVKACAACPGKLLKNPVMIDVHMKSGAHKRRFAKLREAAMNVDPETDVRDLVRAQRLASQPVKPAGDRLSKRAEKKKAKLAAIKARRAKQKVMKAKYKAKKEAKEKAVNENGAAFSESEDEADSSPAKRPATKKRRVSSDAEDEGSASVAAASPAKKQKPLKTKTGSKMSRSALTSPKASKPLNKSKTDAPPKPKQKSTVGPTISPLKGSVSKNAKVMKKRKHSDTAL